MDARCEVRRTDGGLVRAARDMGLEALTLYAFSTENWSRPEDEISALMGLLKEEYAHFVADSPALIDKLLCLKGLHGTVVIDQWCAWARAGEFDALVAALLEKHYDPTYTRSIHAHYARLPQALQGRLGDIDPESFATLAGQLKSTA